MNDEQKVLCEALKHLGYTLHKRVTLYGEVLRLVSEPISQDEDHVFVEAVAERSGEQRRVQIPLHIVAMARKGRRARRRAA